MSAHETVSGSTGQEGARSRRTLEDLIAEQGVAETATYERLLGSGAELWDNDAEFEAFLEILREIRHQKD